MDIGVAVANETIRNVKLGYELLARVPREELREVMHTYGAIKLSQLMRQMLGGRA